MSNVSTVFSFPNPFIHLVLVLLPPLWASASVEETLLHVVLTHSFCFSIIIIQHFIREDLLLVLLERKIENGHLGESVEPGDSSFFSFSYCFFLSPSLSLQFG